MKPTKSFEIADLPTKSEWFCRVGHAVSYSFRMVIWYQFGHSCFITWNILHKLIGKLEGVAKLKADFVREEEEVASVVIIS